MSFWKRAILGKGDESLSDLPNNSAAANQKDKSPPPPPKNTPPPTVGPPPTATGYTHSPPRKPTASSSEPKKLVPQEAPPTFSIFTPKPTAQDGENDAAAAEAISEQAPSETGDDSGDPEEINNDLEETVDQNMMDSEWNPDEQAEALDDVSTQKEGTQEEMKSSALESSENGGDDTFETSFESTTDKPTLQEETLDAHRQNDSDAENENAPALLHLLDTNPDAQTTLDREPLTPLYTDQETELCSAEGTPLSPKFDFINDESVSLQQLQDSTLKRRHESLVRKHELDCKLVSLQAKMAQESMDRADNMATLHRVVRQPLLAAVQQFGTKLLIPPDGPLHSRLGKLEAARMRQVHVVFPNAVASELESPHDYTREELQASFRLEASKADKRIGSLVRRFESIAGTVARRYQEEAASRRAALVQVESLVQDAADLDERRSHELLESVRNLREKLRQEREERKRRDNEVMEMIVERTTELKRALLEAAGST